MFLYMEHHEAIYFSDIYNIKGLILRLNPSHTHHKKGPLYRAPSMVTDRHI